MIIKIDRLVDIMNNTDVSNRSERKGCEMIDSPNRFHIQELLDILTFFVNDKIKQVIKMIIISPENITRICHG